MRYRVLQTIWHTGEKRHCEPGEIVSLEHLSNMEVDLLVQLGVVEPVNESPETIVSVEPINSENASQNATQEV